MSQYLLPVKRFEIIKQNKKVRPLSKEQSELFYLISRNFYKLRNHVPSEIKAKLSFSHAILKIIFTVHIFELADVYKDTGRADA